MVSLQPITDANREAVEALAVTPDQARFVSGVRESMLEAAEEPDARALYWAIYADETPVGFVMIADEVGSPDYIPHYLWKLLIDERYQRRGLGSATLDLIVEYFRNRGVGTMWTSAGQGDGSPVTFYERYGFRRTGDFHDNEILLRLEISSRAGVAARGSLGSVVPESQLVSTEHGLVPKGQGWFVVNARETQWWKRKGRGVLCEFEGAGFEGATDFSQLGINLTILGPGEPMAMYHRENDQEDFLVLAGEALAIVEGEERPLRQWDFVHCPPGTGHVIIGAGERPCLVLAVGARDRSTGPDWGAYTVDETAQRHGAGVERETTAATEAYARFPSSELTRYQEGWLPERVGP